MRKLPVPPPRADTQETQNPGERSGPRELRLALDDELLAMWQQNGMTAEGGLEDLALTGVLYRFSSVKGAGGGGSR